MVRQIDVMDVSGHHASDSVQLVMRAPVEYLRPCRRLYGVDVRGVVVREVQAHHVQLVIVGGVVKNSGRVVNCVK